MKIAFVDVQFHKKTKSSLFFKELLLKHHEVVEFWHDGQERSINIEEINNGNFDAIIFWQEIFQLTKIKKMKCQNIIWVPMYDTEMDRKFNFIRTMGYTFLNIKIISFCITLKSVFEKYGFKNILNVQYSPKPQFDNISENIPIKMNILFWQRVKEIDWFLIKKLLNRDNINKFILKNNLDQENKQPKLPNKKDTEAYKMEILNGWLNEEKYINILKESDVFIAPRKYEGIGMSFINAMTNGLIVIAPNTPTANEYIKDNINGYLYDIKNPKQINLSNINEIRRNLKNDMTEKFNIWQNEQEKILLYVELPLNKKVKKITYFLVYNIYGPTIEKSIQVIRYLIKNINKWKII